MRQLIMIIFCLIIAIFSQAAETKSVKANTWKPVLIEKIVITKKVPEGVALVKHQNGQKTSYSVVYLINDKILRTRILPREIYEQLEKRLHQKVLMYGRFSRKACNSQIVYSKTTASKDRTPASVTNASVCLAANSSSTRRAQSEFMYWYRDVRAIFNL